MGLSQVIKDCSELLPVSAQLCPLPPTSLMPCVLAQKQEKKSLCVNKHHLVHQISPKPNTVFLQRLGSADGHQGGTWQSSCPKKSLERPVSSPSVPLEALLLSGKLKKSPYLQALCFPQLMGYIMCGGLYILSFPGSSSQIQHPGLKDVRMDCSASAVR